MLRDRLRTSAILITIVVALIYCDAKLSVPGGEGLWLLPLMMFFALGTAWDIANLLSRSGRAVAKGVTLLATGIVAISAAVPMIWSIAGQTYPVDCPIGHRGWIAVGCVVAIFLVLLREMKHYGTEHAEKGTIERTCSGVFVSLYVGLPMAFLVALRSLGEGTWGLAALLTMIAVTKSADSGAYFTGKTLGKNKLIPRLSPGKTWEGAIGGTITATIVAYVCLKWLFPEIAGNANPPMKTPAISALTNPLYGALLLGPLLTVTGMIGDLAESLVKRDSGAKDSGNLLPGLGGVWDVTDSLIAAVMPAFLCFAAGVGG